MLKSAVRLFGLAALLVTLSGCQHLLHPFRSSTFSCHKRQSYQGQVSVPLLVIPAGLDAPDTSGALHLPALNEPAPPARKAREPCLDQPPPYKVPKPAPRPQA